MLVSNVTLNQNNYSQKYNTNFTAIKSVKCEGLYKKYPELANNLIVAFKANPRAMKFCKDYDVDIIFYAIKDCQNSVKSSVNIFFDNISKSKIKKFFQKFLTSNDDKVVISSWANEYSVPRSIEKSTAILTDRISPERKVGDKWTGGMLDSHIENADKKIQEALAKKSEKQQKKAAELQMQKDAKENLENAQVKLQKSIDDLMNQDS